MEYPKSFYQVFECGDPNNPFDYATVVLFDSERLDEAHAFAYEAWLKNQSKVYTIIQPYDGSCRGGYGLAEE